MMPWGKLGREFLTRVFLPNGIPHKEHADDIVERCAKKAGTDPLSYCLTVMPCLERFESCGVLLRKGGGMLREYYYLNTAPGMAELLGFNHEEGVVVLEGRCEPFDGKRALALFEEREFCQPLRAGLRGADIIAKLTSRAKKSDLLNDAELYEGGKVTMIPRARQQLDYFIPRCVDAGILHHEITEREGRRADEYRVTDEARAHLPAQTGALRERAGVLQEL
jgi:hypothetical protein